jgi:intracellular multiplication protein IcmD
MILGSNKFKSILFFTLSLILMMFGTVVLAADSGAKDLSSIASNITSSFQSLGELLIGTSYLAGVGFAIAGVFKFKQHRDNPTQIPLGTPLALVGVGVVLVFLPSIFGPSGATIFGSGSTTGGFTGKGAEKIAQDSGS